MDRSCIELRDVTEADVVQFFEHTSDPQPVLLAAPARAMSTWPAFERQWAGIRSGEHIIFRAVFLNDNLTGYVAKCDQAAVPSVSYWFARKFWGQGLAKASMSLFLESITERPLHARVASGNSPSLNLLKANGFVQIGKSSYFSEALHRQIEEIILRLDA